MSNTIPVVTPSDERSAGATCAHCSQQVRLGEMVALCPTCGRSHHSACWERAGRCGSYDCAPARQALGERTAALKISDQDLATVLPVASLPRPAFAPRSSIPEERGPRPWNKLALIAFGFALLGAGLCGAAGYLLTLRVTLAPYLIIAGVVVGLVAIALGAVALGAIQRGRQKGLLFGIFAVLLGVLDMVGWAIVFSLGMGSGEGALLPADFQPDLRALESLAPTINRAMRANVLIRTRTGWLDGTSIGSGVIVQVRDGQVYILTNRHVIDPDFRGQAKADVDSQPEVLFVDQGFRSGNVIWRAPNGVDLALVRVAYASGEIMTARCRLDRNYRVGDKVFAMGNPHGLGWTHTEGVISQFRIQDALGTRVPVIQTQAVINSGNSGGGLYDKDGFLIGINTWAQDKRVAEGLNFAIALEILKTITPPGLELEGPPREPHEP